MRLYLQMRDLYGIQPPVPPVKGGGSGGAPSITKQNLNHKTPEPVVTSLRVLR